MEKANQACPNSPTSPSFEVRHLRARLILEEALETIRALGLIVAYPEPIYGWREVTCESVDISNDGDCDLVELADGLADLQVVTLGTAVACGIDLEPVFDEVMRSNNSKWWTSSELDSEAFNADYQFERVDLGRFCVTDAGGKVIKSPSYSAANIAPILEAQK